jgi:hypothetical protein
MIVDLRLAVSAQELFEVIERSLKADLSEQTELKSGVVFQKTIRNKLGQSIPQTVRVIAYETERLYAVEFTQAENQYTVSYELKALSPSETEVRYEQKFESGLKLKQMNYRLLSLLYERGSRKRLITMLKQMERYIIEQRSSS